MTSPTRRGVLGAAGATAAAGGLVAGVPTPVVARTPSATEAPQRVADAAEFGIRPDTQRDMTDALQAAIDQTATHGGVLALPPGRILTRPLTLRDGTSLLGTGPRTRLVHIGTGPLLTAPTANDLRLEDLTVDGMGAVMSDPTLGLIACAGVTNLHCAGLRIRSSQGHGLSMANCGGTLSDLTVEDVANTGIFALDSTGLMITDCRVTRAGNNGIQVWRTELGEDGTIVRGNRVSEIRSDAGGTGQNGNGINIFRAGSVIVEGNHVRDCAYSAVRGNAASNLSIIANQAHRIGEVALYAEFGFQGALIANNLVDQAATGISVTNFNEGGRLAVVQGNLIRNLARREFEPVDKRGNGISVEADTAITGNVIEEAPTAGLWIGWGRYMRNVVATGNIVRRAGTAVAISGDVDAGSVLIAQNHFSDTQRGVRLANLGEVQDQEIDGITQDGRIVVRGNVRA